MPTSAPFSLRQINLLRPTLPKFELVNFVWILSVAVNKLMTFLLGL